MTAAFYWLRRAVEIILYPFDLLPPTIGLIAVALVTSVVMVWVIGKVTPQERVKKARSKMAAAVYEIRLFLDSPRRVFAAQGKLLWGSLLYTAYLLPALFVLAVPLALLYVHIEGRWGIEPIEPKSRVVLTIDHEAGFDGYQIEPGELPEGLAVTAPPVVDVDKSQVYVRVDVAAAGVHTLPIRAGDSVVTKEIVAGPQGPVIAPVRTSGLDILWEIGLEEPIPDESPIESIAVDYRDADQTWLGVGWPWWLFWLIVATVLAFVVKGPLGVEL